MTPAERHAALDELLAAFLDAPENRGKLPSRTPIMDLVKWSYGQLEPTNDARRLRREWLAHRFMCDACAAGSQLIPQKLCDVGGPLFKAMEAAIMSVPS